MKHFCKLYEYPRDGFGASIDDCIENEDGEFWVSNSEYATQVNFCPVCGEKAPKQVEGKESWTQNK